MLKQILNKRNIYFDHNATTHIAPSVRSIMNRVLKSYWGNPSSGYSKGKMSAQIIEKAREQLLLRSELIHMKCIFLVVQPNPIMRY